MRASVLVDAPDAPKPMLADDTVALRLGHDDSFALERPAKSTGHDARGLYRRITAGIALTDAFSVALALFLVAQLSATKLTMDWVGTPLIFLLVPLGWVGIFLGFGLYAPTHLSPIEEFRRVIGASSFGMCALVMIGFWSHSAPPRSAVGILWALVLVFELMIRRVWRLEVARRQGTGTLSLRTLVVGTNDEARDISTQLQSDDSGYRPVGFVSAGSTNATPSDLPVVSGISQLVDAIETREVECLFIASSALRSDEMLKVMQIARQAGVDVRISANLPEILASRVAIQNIGSSMALSVRPLQLSKAQNLVKRGFDLAMAGFILLITSPLWVAIAAAVRLTSPGPVFFRQARVTKGGRRFNMIKFRTMSDQWDPDALGIDVSTPFFKMSDDPRVTRVGRFLRKTSLDELPQLLNVIAGDMSLVGPRPLPEDQVKAHPELLSGRLEVSAGMTGWWQIQGRSEVPAEQAVHLDLFYIENWSLSLDLFILLKTFGAVITKAGAF